MSNDPEKILSAITNTSLHQSDNSKSSDKKSGDDDSDDAKVYVSSSTIPLLDRYLKTVFKDRYRIEKELGRGGIGVVYFARDIQLMSRPVVVKVLLEETNTNEWVKNKFRQEVEALARIDHPSVVGVLDTGETPDLKPFLVMQYIDGVNLRSIMTPEGVNIERVAAIMRQLGSALNAAHEKGIFHRDLKPENIMLQMIGREEVVKLIDFGVAKVLDSQEGQATKAAMMVGTYHYMASEQMLGEQITAASDIFALAVIAYELLTGRRPFIVEATTTTALLINILEHQQRGPNLTVKALRPSVSELADEIILQSLSYQAKARYQNAEEFGRELAEALLIKQPMVFPGSTKSLEKDHSVASRTASKTNFQPRNLSAIREESIRPEDLQQNRTISADNVVNAADSANIHRAVNQVKTGNNLKTAAIGLVGLIVLLSLVLGVKAYRSSLVDSTKSASLAGATPLPAPTAVVPTRNLSYWIILQRYRDKKPFKAPMRLTKELLFQEEDQIKFFFISNQQGYLYILNEGMTKADGSQDYWNLLFPVSETINSEIPANKEQSIQELKFDKQEGKERLWLVWAESKVDELEALKIWATDKTRGEIQDAATTAKLKQFFAENYKIHPIVEQDDSVKKMTTIRGRAKIMVHPIDLEHQ